MITESIGDGQGISIGFDGFRADPIALALIGTGIAWLLAVNTGMLDAVVQDDRVRAAQRRLADLTGRGTGGMPEGQGPAFNPAIAGDESNRTGGWVHQAADAARGAIRAVRDTAGEYTSRPAGWLRDAGRTALDRAGGYAGEQASTVGGRMAGAFARHPLLIGAAGLLAGALLASLLPPTRVEDEWVGQSRDQTLKRAGELGRETLQRLRRNIDRDLDRAAGEPAAGEATVL